MKYLIIMLLCVALIGASSVPPAWADAFHARPPDAQELSTNLFQEQAVNPFLNWVIRPFSAKISSVPRRLAPASSRYWTRRAARIRHYDARPAALSNLTLEIPILMASAFLSAAIGTDLAHWIFGAALFINWLNHLRNIIASGRHDPNVSLKQAIGSALGPAAVFALYYLAAGVGEPDVLSILGAGAFQAAYDAWLLRFKADPAFDELCNTVDMGHIYEIPRDVLQRLRGAVSEGDINGSLIDWSRANITREQGVALFRRGGIPEPIIQVLMGQFNIIVAEGAGTDTRAHELFHRIYRSMPPDMRAEFENAWNNLPDSWKEAFTHDTWKDHYLPEDHAEEFWCFFMQEFTRPEDLDRKITGTLAQLYHKPGIAQIIQKYDLLAVFQRHFERADPPQPVQEKSLVVREVPETELVPRGLSDAIILPPEEPSVPLGGRIPPAPLKMRATREAMSAFEATGRFPDWGAFLLAPGNWGNKSFEQAKKWVSEFNERYRLDYSEAARPYHPAYHTMIQMAFLAYEAGSKEKAFEAIDQWLRSRTLEDKEWSIRMAPLIRHNRSASPYISEDYWREQFNLSDEETTARVYEIFKFAHGVIGDHTQRQRRGQLGVLDQHRAIANYLERGRLPEAPRYSVEGAPSAWSLVPSQARDFFEGPFITRPLEIRSNGGDRSYAVPLAIIALPDGSVVLGSDHWGTNGAVIYRPDGSFQPLQSEPDELGIRKDERTLAAHQFGGLAIDDHHIFAVASGVLVRYSHAGNRQIWRQMALGGSTDITGLAYFENNLYALDVHRGLLVILDPETLVTRTEIPLPKGVELGAGQVAVNPITEELYILGPQLLRFNIRFRTFSWSRRWPGVPLGGRMTVDTDGTIYASGFTEEQGNRIFVIDPAGRMLGTMQLPYPQVGALHVYNNHLYIAHNGGFSIIPLGTLRSRMIPPSAPPSVPYRIGPAQHRLSRAITESA